jgi:hypothetical protein
MILDCGLRKPDTGKTRKDEFLNRTMNFALPVAHVIESLPRVKNGMENQLLRAGTSFGTKRGNYPVSEIRNPKS